MSDEAQDPVDTGGAEQIPDPSIEQEARSMGWAPKENFRGNPDSWTDAETFVKRGREFLPILKKNNSVLQQKLREQESQVQHLNQVVQGLLKDKVEGEERAYKRALQQLKQEKAAALEEGNHAQVIALDDAMDELKELRDKEVKKFSAPQKQPTQDDLQARQVFIDWVNRNPWYRDNQRAQRFAVGFAQELKDEGVPEGIEFLEEMKARMQRDMPDLFPKGRQSPVDSGSSRAASSSGSKGKLSTKDLTSYERQVMTELINRGVFKTEAEYLELYQQQNQPS